MPDKEILITYNCENSLNEFIRDFPEYNFIKAKNDEETIKILKENNNIGLILLTDLQNSNLLKNIKKVKTNSKIIFITNNDLMDMPEVLHYAEVDEFIDPSFNRMETKKIFTALLGENKDLTIRKLGNINDKIEFARNLLERQYHRQLSLRMIAKKVCLNYKYLSRVFKKKTGKSYNKYKLQLKIDSSKKLLKERNLGVNQIAYKLGYQNPDSFMKMFKKYTGLTPSGYRNRNKSKKITKDISPKKFLQLCKVFQRLEKEKQNGSKSSKKDIGRR